MIRFFLQKIFGTKNERELKRLVPLVAQINALEPQCQSLSDESLRGKTAEFRRRLEQGETLEAILPEAFAVVREAARRTLKMRHFDCQLVGGMVLHHGKIAEMKTGEGKTLVATLPVYLNALTGNGVHVITVNDYLARRDSEWMGTVYRFLGLSVGVIVHGLTDAERKAAYACDVTYGTNNEFGFDYLRDNMKYSLDQYVQRNLQYAIVDEVDSILIDEARTPLIISGPAEQSTDLYYTIDRIIPFLKKETHYTVDEKARTVMLTEAGAGEVEGRIKVSNLYDPNNITVLHHVNQALRAHVLYRLDVDYVVKEDKVVIVDEFTGRLMPGRRWSDGLHQAVEAKEGVTIENENQTLASITFQNYFRMYKKLAGMTGTADTEAAEFAKIYNLEVMVIPTNQLMIRTDHSDIIYKTEAEKFRAVVKEIEECHQKGQPVLVGTISIEKSERIAEMLKHRGIAHHVLNAKHHEKEAEIVAQAGRFKVLTISTNMAGRGTDIMLGGNPEFLARAKEGAVEEFRAECQKEKEQVIEAGGLHIIGTERHESRRIDNQLRGRSGRQGDPGSTRFYLSLDDDLLRIFGGERIAKLMERFGLKEDEEIQHPWLNRAIENAQKKVEAHNFSIRKNVLEYDDVMNLQRKTVYQRRREILGAEETKDLFLDMLDQVVTQLMDQTDPEQFVEQVKQTFGLAVTEVPPEKPQEREEFGKRFFDHLLGVYAKKGEEYGREVLGRVEKFLILSTLDQLWKDHLLSMDHLREGIGLRGYGQKDPLLEYKREGYTLFRMMMDRFISESVQKCFHVRISAEQQAPALEERAQTPMQMSRGGAPHRTVQGGVNPFGRAAQAPAAPQTIRHTTPKVGRNDPCPCGSGKKYKKCHGA